MTVLPRREVPGRNPWLCALLVGLLLAGDAAQAAFNVDNLKRGNTVPPRPEQALIFGTVKVLDEAGRTSFPSDALFPRLPGLRLYGLERGGKRTFAREGLVINPDGTYAAWVPRGDYALTATWPDEDNDLQVAIIALIRAPGEGRVFYAGELVVETAATGIVFKHLPSPYEVRDVTVVEGSAEAARRTLERRSGPLPGPTWILLWCTQGVPSGADPGNAGSLGRLDAGCGSTVTESRPPLPEP